MIPDNLYYCELAKCNCAVVNPKGHWKFRNDNSLISTGYYECDRCEIGKELTKTNFCPYCGADMREEN